MPRPIHRESQSSDIHGVGREVLAQRADSAVMDIGEFPLRAANGVLVADFYFEGSIGLPE
jgi:hypothetical protein